MNKHKQMTLSWKGHITKKGDAKSNNECHIGKLINDNISLSLRGNTGYHEVKWSQRMSSVNVAQTARWSRRYGIPCCCVVTRETCEENVRFKALFGKQPGKKLGETEVKWILVARSLQLIRKQRKAAEHGGVCRWEVGVWRQWERSKGIWLGMKENLRSLGGTEHLIAFVTKAPAGVSKANAN